MIVPGGLIKIPAKALFSVWIYLSWFACVFAGKYQVSWASLLFVAVSWFLLFKIFKPLPKTSLQLLALAAVGLAFDAVLFATSAIRFTPEPQWGYLPLWLISLWLVFVAALPMLSGLFQKRYLIAAIAGAVFGPLSYKAGEQFDVLHMNSLSVLIIYAVFWALYFPLAVWYCSCPAQKGELL